MATTKKSNSWLLALALFAIPATFNGISWIAAISDKKPEVVEHPASKIDGYATVPASYDVTASPNYKWTHEGVSTGRMILAFVIFAVGGLVVLLDLDLGKALIITGVSWLGGTLLGVGKYSFHYYDEKKYEKAIDSETYELNKADLDKIFEQ